MYVSTDTQALQFLEWTLEKFWECTAKPRLQFKGRTTEEMSNAVINCFLLKKRKFVWSFQTLGNQFFQKQQNQSSKSNL